MPSSPTRASSLSEELTRPEEEDKYTKNDFRLTPNTNVQIKDSNERLGDLQPLPPPNMLKCISQIEATSPLLEVSDEDLIAALPLA